LIGPLDSEKQPVESRLLQKLKNKKIYSPSGNFAERAKNN